MRWVSIEDLAAAWSQAPELPGRIPVQTVRRWMSEDKAAGKPWPRTLRRPYRYDPEFAQERFEARREGRKEALTSGVSEPADGL